MITCEKKLPLPLTQARQLYRVSDWLPAVKYNQGGCVALSECNAIIMSQDVGGGGGGGALSFWSHLSMKNTPSVWGCGEGSSISRACLALVCSSGCEAANRGSQREENLWARIEGKKSSSSSGTCFPGEIAGPPPPTRDQRWGRPLEGGPLVSERPEWWQWDVVCV